MFMDAIDRMRRTNSLQNYLPIFLPWFIFDEYRMPLPLDYEMKLTEEEIEMKSKFKLDDEQLFWRRWAIPNKCQNDLKLFHQEYPSTYKEAFLAAGRSVFNQQAVDSYEKRCSEGRTCVLEREIDEKISPVNVNRSFECWQIWKLPHDGHEYIMGVDVAEGLLTDPGSRRSDPDCHAAVVYDRMEDEVVALYHGRCEHRELAYQCYLGGHFYNEAWIGPEVPHGIAVLQFLKDYNYDNIYNRQIHDDMYFRDEIDALGWRTTTLTRPQMIQTLVNAINNNQITLWSLDIINQMKTFIVNERGKEIHLAGEKDDLLFGLMIALQMHVRCPFIAEPYQFSSTTASQVVKPSEINTSGVMDVEAEETNDVLSHTV